MILNENKVCDKKLSIEEIAKIMGSNVEDLNIEAKDGYFIISNERGASVIFPGSDTKISREEIANKSVYFNGKILDCVSKEDFMTLDSLIENKRKEGDNLSNKISKIFNFNRGR